MMESHETVKEHCKHKDCAHRGRWNGNSSVGEACCDYILHEREPRGCPISRCNKYVPKSKYKKKTKNWW